MATSEELTREIATLKGQIAGLQKELVSPAIATLDPEASPDEATTYYIAEARRAATLAPQRQGVEAAIAHFQSQLTQKEAQLKEVHRQEQLQRANAILATNREKMHQLSERLKELREETIATLKEIEAIGKPYSEASQAYRIIYHPLPAGSMPDEFLLASRQGLWFPAIAHENGKRFFLGMEQIDLGKPSFSPPVNYTGDRV